MADNLKAFMVKNRAVKEPTKYPASADFVDENGEPMEWVLRPVPPEKNDQLVGDSMIADFDAKGNPIMKFKESLYRKNLIVESVIFPNLNNAELQDFYKVKEPGDLVNAMLNINEYKQLVDKIQEINGFKVNIDKKAKEVKN
ncbi:Uncharacterised protein [Acetobacterium wieringae]|uniref:phage tail assembly chaperone n=1 Tax=Acetobacterium wieringae TaxID=52694 RepID=UPI001D2ABB2A|nr:hypothetical protein [Acetobacterium wieringae]VUZ28536.1 Uncharacterised protein [Acetobacterium wieringae]